MDVSEEKLPLIKELCFIAHKRNSLNNERSKLRYKINYLQKIKDGKRKMPKRLTKSTVNMEILKIKRDQLAVRIKIAKLTISSRTKVRRLVKQLIAKIDYYNGYIDKIFFFKIEPRPLHDDVKVLTHVFYRKDIERYHNDYVTERFLERK